MHLFDDLSHQKSNNLVHELVFRRIRYFYIALYYVYIVLHYLYISLHYLCISLHYLYTECLHRRRLWLEFVTAMQ